jgi:hypothetical protein
VFLFDDVTPGSAAQKHLLTPEISFLQKKTDVQQ